jgi:hypothetical protein
MPHLPGPGFRLCLPPGEVFFLKSIGKSVIVGRRAYCNHNVEFTIISSKQYFNYLCTYDLYSPEHNVLDACKYITRGSGRGLSPGIVAFFGPCEMASSHFKM